MLTDLSGQLGGTETSLMPSQDLGMMHIADGAEQPMLDATRPLWLAPACLPSPVLCHVYSHTQGQFDFVIPQLLVQLRSKWGELAPRAAQPLWPHTSTHILRGSKPPVLQILLSKHHHC